MIDTVPGGRPGQEIEKDREGDFHQRLGRRKQVSPIIELEGHPFASQIHLGTDILPAVNPVPGRPDNLRHVRPHGIEPRTGESPSVPGPGNGDPSGFSLIPQGRDDFRGPIVIPQLFILRVQGLMDQPVGTVLDAAETVFKGFEKSTIANIQILRPIAL
jgi:hypothetical protein